MTPEPKPKSTLIQAFRYAFQGISFSLRTQRNMRIHFVTAVLVLILGFFLRFQAEEWLALFVCIALVIGSELINTAIEATVDLASPEKRALAKIAKDSAAAAVLIFAILSALIGIFIIIQAILRLLGSA